MQTIACDVLIIGAGAAGIRAAIAASQAGAQVIMVAAEEVTRGGATFSSLASGWGIQALAASERTAENVARFYDDIIRVGLGGCDPQLVQVLVEEAGACFDDLCAYGLKFKRGANGEYIRTTGCFSEAKRAFLTENMHTVRQSFLSIIQRLAVRIVTGSATDLIVRDGACFGAHVWQASSDWLQIRAPATILATGGGSGIFENNMSCNASSGDGYALAHLAGAELSNMEFVQFALGLKNNGCRHFLPVAEIAQPGRVTDASGREVLGKYLPKSVNLARLVERRQTHMPFSCRDAGGLIDIAIATALKKRNKLLWQRNGSLEDSFEICHCAHAFNGGVRINEQGESTVPGLFAAGEVAAGPHGADRIGGCMMTATQVFGRRAGQYAAKRAKHLHAGVFSKCGGAAPCDDRRAASNEDSNNILALIERRIREAMGRYAGVLRSKKGLTACRNVLDTCKNQLSALGFCGIPDVKRYTAVRNMIITASLVVESALARKESKGSHYREDLGKRALS